jgi:hypothetical protein
MKGLPTNNSYKDKDLTREKRLDLAPLINAFGEYLKKLIARLSSFF